MSMPTFRRRPHIGRRAIGTGLLAALALSAGSGPAAAEGLSFLDPQGPVAAAQRDHFYAVILLMLVVVVPVLIFTPLVAWRYRYRNHGARYAPDWKFSWPLEALIWGVPVAVVVVLSVWIWQETHDLDPYAPLAADKSLRVEVIGYDWKWLFVYPDLHIATMGVLGFPSDRSLDIRLTSASVMQSFFIPALGSQIYAMAGMRTKLHLKANRPGTFLGENTQYNGKGFHDQKFRARAMTARGFTDWVKQVRAKGVPLDAKAYDVVRAKGGLTDVRRAVAGGSMPPGTVYFTDVSADLLANVMHQFNGGASSSEVIVSERSPANDTALRSDAGHAASATGEPPAREE
ncbi:cytochrome ubiquinol oxidase subunit II family protein [Pararhizobium mangrovi]|uniref:Cytochrome ubiquinol oxidase subunit II n=1 Tax=Pararhizobium mangrovi TaxID=2590452 RepID=A0A506U951_9HYPH|nr:cytochrome ubiquinol oxidase subunit II [Pararhizobium mangrovi]TPW29611.1 cytochrome ubiquinol oxidase subunit II [Pararhizobium mangrovi]